MSAIATKMGLKEIYTLKQLIERQKLNEIYETLKTLYPTFTDTYSSATVRPSFTYMISWAIPNEMSIDAIKEIACDRTILSIGSGNGLWEHLMTLAGLKVIATDTELSLAPFCRVIQMDAIDAINTFTDANILFI